ncbi:MAG: hypothetical protein JXB25_05935 [Deltaproteobacteria bacterium]|nr:hypothetical protein [Deltaproteobacteria bacterium]
MKRTWSVMLFSLLGLITTASFCFGGFRIPDDAYRMHELEGALKEAKKDGWALTFLITMEETTCPLAEKASLIAIRVLEKKTIIVYFNPDNDNFSMLPETVGKAALSGELGTYIPQAVIVNSDCDRIIDRVPYIHNEEAYLKRLEEADQRIANPSWIDRIRDFL